MDHGRVNGHGLFSRDVRSVLQIVVLPLLFRLQVETGQTTQVLLAHGFVHLRGRERRGGKDEEERNDGERKEERRI